MNKVILIGNLTKDVEVMETSSGVKVAKFTLAVKRSYGEETDFFTIVAWRNLADNCSRFLKKGNKCAVVGSIQIRSFDGQDGTKKYVTEIVAENVEFLSSKKEESKPKVEETEQIEIDNDSLPFWE